MGVGKVFIVGAGPGDPALLTLRGAQALQEAEVLVYDHLANPRLLERCRPECERIYAGKSAGRQALSQEAINRLLVEQALRGKRVVRLKGGDPFMFGRGGEEALELAERGIEFEVVPGITAATAASAYAGIPLTHRGLASSAALVTGHEEPGKPESDVRWELLAAGAGTLAVYMGVKNLAAIVERLLRHGRPPGTPAALIRWGTLPDQQTLTAPLGEIVERCGQAGFQPPALLVVGEVVRLREKLRWFDTRPLFGRRIVVTRSRGQASQLSALLEGMGARVIEFPTIEIAPVEDLSPLDRAIGGLEAFSWLVFTSANGVEIFFARLFGLGRDGRALHGLRVAAIGGQTASRLEDFGIRADLVPERFTSAGTLEAFRAVFGASLQGESVLLPGSEIARDELPEGLREMGARVVQVPVYRNLRPDYSEEQLEALFSPPVDLVTFTSSSTATHLAAILDGCGRGSRLKELKGASIGPVTTRTARELGIPVAVESPQQTVAGLAEAIRAYFTCGGEP